MSGVDPSRNLEPEALRFILQKWKEFPEACRSTEEQAMDFLMDLFWEHPELVQGYCGGFQELTAWLLGVNEVSKN